VTDSHARLEPNGRERLELRRLEVGLGREYLAMVDEFESAGEGYPYNNIELARRDFAAFVRELEDEERGVGLPPGVFPQITFVLVLAGRTVLGEIRFRPSVAPAHGPGPDNIGYNIRPTARRKGFGGRQLALVLDEARALGLPGVRLAVEGENPASAAIILKHGGVLLPRPDDAQAVQVALYWIALRWGGVPIAPT